MEIYLIKSKYFIEISTFSKKHFKMRIETFHSENIEMGHFDSSQMLHCWGRRGVHEILLKSRCFSKCFDFDENGIFVPPPSKKY